jgi:transcriptional regulator GlxA family with amidase domain
MVLPNYSMIALANAVEPLRMANHVCGSTIYEWVILSLDGQAVTASNGLSLSPMYALDATDNIDILFVCGGLNIHNAVTPPLLNALHRLAKRGTALGSLCTGGYALAKAGLVDHYRTVIHWENMSALRAEFPKVIFIPQLFSIDGDRYTCSGGVAPLDLMLNIIKRQCGGDIVSMVSEQFIVERIRNNDDCQHVPLRAQVGGYHQSLIKVAAMMEANIKEPLSLDELASSIGLSRRHIERVFKRHLDCVPTKYYLELRLRRARELLLQTPMSIMAITTACGFQSLPHFSKSYRNLFGHPPSVERRMNRAAM